MLSSAQLKLATNQRKMTFAGRQSSVEDNLWWKTTFSGTQPSVEDNLGLKMPFGGRQPSMEDDLQWILACCLVHFAAYFPLKKHPVSIFLISIRKSECGTAQPSHQRASST